MKSVSIILCFAGLASVAHAQLSTGATGLTVKSGTQFSSGGLTLVPSADITLQNQTITLSATPLTVGSGATIAQVYTISPAITFSGAAGIRYASGALNGNQESTLSLIKSGATSTFTSVSSSTGGAGTYYVSATGLNSVLLNRVTATSTAVPLPIFFQNFTVAAGASCTLNLSWSADDATTNNFTIERSADGKSFEALPARVLQSGRQFTGIDVSPLAGRNFYRLSISEPGTPVVYSTVITANGPCARAVQASVYPNPAGDMLTVDLGAAPSSPVTIHVMDLSGKMITTMQASGQFSKLNVQHIAAGSYLLQVRNGATTEYIKFVKR